MREHIYTSLSLSLKGICVLVCKVSQALFIIQHFTIFGYTIHVMYDIGGGGGDTDLKCRLPTIQKSNLSILVGT